MLAMKCVSLFLLLGRAGVWAEEHDLSFVLYCGEVVLRRWIPDGSLGLDGAKLPVRQRPPG